MESIFSSKGNESYISRINQLTPETERKWGTMSVSQMLAHLNVTFDMSFTDRYPKPTGLKKWMLKLLVKGSVVGPKPYKKNLRTAPIFLVKDDKDFDKEKKKLLAYVHQVHKLGADYFEGRSSHSFGKLTKGEWDNMFSKHLDHHLLQFGV
ncbi:MAG TPA: DUF1569 domain-containing protein [Saprospiraceae bacterium]|nr:DUF1569 domain-containing protein [Saprospiraceae bacterium]